MAELAAEGPPGAAAYSPAMSAGVLDRLKSTSLPEKKDSMDLGSGGRGGARQQTSLKSKQNFHRFRTGSGGVPSRVT
jgi:hypothetical protein